MANTKKETKSSAPKATPKKTTTKSTTAKPKTTKPAVKKVETKQKVEKKVIQSENNYGKTILAAILIIVVLIGGYIAVQFKNGKGPEIFHVATADEKKFKNEYESLNGTENNKKISVSSENHVKYISIDEAAKMLDSGSGVIYFGFAGCPWCRNAVPVLVDAVKSTELDTLYYVNIRPESKKENDIRDEFTLDSRNKARKTKDASDSYYEVLLALANELNDYVLTTDTDKKVNTGEKRLYAPTVVAVKNGVVVGFHEGTYEDHELDEENHLSDLTKDQEKDLLNEYTKIISKYLDDNCGEEC